MRKEDSRLGDKMPDRRIGRFSDMKAGPSHLSEEWHEMHPNEAMMSEKWVDQKPSAARMSEKFVEQMPSKELGSDKWHSMDQESRKDPYAMFPSAGDRTQPMNKSKSTKPSGAGKVERSNQHTEFGSTREI